MSSGDGTNFIASAFGAKRSGKSHELAKMAASFPRRIVFDFVGEFRADSMSAVAADSLEAAARVLREVRERGKWTVLLHITPEEAIEVIRVLAAARGGYAKAVGGVVIEIGEVDLIAPNSGKIDEAVYSVFARGRHVGPISSLVASQRPPSVHRIVTSQSDIVCVFRQNEPRDADTFADRIRSDAVPLIRTMKYRHFLRYKTNFGILQLVNPNGKILNEWTASDRIDSAAAQTV